MGVDRTSGQACRLHLVVHPRPAHRARPAHALRAGGADQRPVRDFGRGDHQQCGFHAGGDRGVRARGGGPGRIHRRVSETLRAGEHHLRRRPDSRAAHRETVAGHRAGRGRGGLGRPYVNFNIMENVIYYMAVFKLK